MAQTAYDRKFFEERRAGSRASARALLPIVLELVRAESVLDIGCGTGTWLAVMKELGLSKVHGVDGDYVDRDLLEVEPHEFEARDLGEPLDLGRRFDLVMSMEVAEHLPDTAADIFIESLTRHGPVILFSAAIPKQGGTNHINEQWPDYWAERFKGHGYSCIDCIRPRVWNDQRILWWYAQNAMIFAAPWAIERWPALARAAERHGGDPLSLVHPLHYLWKAKHFSFTG